jgi:hypothetical protein
MDIATGQSLFHFGLAIPIVGLVFFKLLPRVRRESFQQKIFKVRNDLFERVWEKGLSFEDPAYRETRDMLNGAIRLADDFRVPTFLAITLMSRCAPRGVWRWIAERGKSGVSR